MNVSSLVPPILPRNASAQALSVGAAVDDVLVGFRHYQLWTTLGWQDIKQRYRRSTIGPFWITISMAALIFGLSYMYSGLFDQQFYKYISYVATGIIVFSLISSIITEGSEVFISGTRAILQTKVPFSVYVYRTIWRNFLLFAHNIIIYLLLIALGVITISPALLLAPAGLLLIGFNGIWIGLLLGTLSARFRDVPPIVASLTQLAFFLSPVFWRPEQMPGRQHLIVYNPFYYMIEMVRMPLLGELPTTQMWCVSIAISAAGGVMGLLFFARFRRRIAYWV